jgi:cytidine deaminase
LEKRIAESEIGCQIDIRSKKADLLIYRDYTEVETLKNGQNVRDTFPSADLFVNADNQEDCASSLDRFVRLVFGDPQQTPTIDEHCMFHSNGAALRSGDLGRQVGAIIASTEGDVICHGTNEAPKAFGGPEGTRNCKTLVD